MIRRASSASSRPSPGTSAASANALSSSAVDQNPVAGAYAPVRGARATSRVCSPGSSPVWPGGVLVRPLGVVVGAGAGQAQRLEDGGAHVLGERGAGDGLDGQSDQREADVGVLEVLVAGVHDPAVQHLGEQRRAVGERGLQLPEVGVRAVAGDAGLVAQQLAHRHPARSASRRPPARGRSVPIGSSSRIRPASTSCRTTVAVNVLECDATWKRCPGVSGVPVAASATPTAAESTSSPPERTATWTPGTRRCAACVSSHVRR